MNCSNCGAKNDVEARFCAECGTPLDDVVVETAKVERVFEKTSEEATIISTTGKVTGDVKTLTVDHAKVVASVDDTDNTEEVDDNDASSGPEDTSPPPSVPALAGNGGDQNGNRMDLGGGGDEGRGGSNRTWIIVGVIVLVVLVLCCCCSVLIGGWIGSNPDAIDDLIREITMLPGYLPFI